MRVEYRARVFLDRTVQCANGEPTWYWEVIERDESGEFGKLTDYGNADTWTQAMDEVSTYVYR